MRKLLTVIIVLLLLAPLGLRAQLDPVSLAFRAFQEENLDKAQELIDKAAVMDAYNQAPKTWYLRAYIYKTIFKNQHGIDQTSPEAQDNRDIAIDSYFKSIALDSAREYTDDSEKSIRFLANTYYNDAAFFLTALDSFDIAFKLFEDFKKHSLHVNPETNLNPKEIEFKLFVASKYSTIFDKADLDKKPEDISEKIINLYKEVLELDSNQISANYNLGIHFYNQGVNIIENIDYNADFELIMQKQMDVIDLFNFALPYMLRAHKLDPTRKDSIRGLSGIYYGLNDLEKSEYYQELLEELEQGE